LGIMEKCMNKKLILILLIVTVLFLTIIVIFALLEPAISIDYKTIPFPTYLTPPVAAYTPKP
jgi:hypothetical protein